MSRSAAGCAVDSREPGRQGPEGADQPEGLLGKGVAPFLRPKLVCVYLDMGHSNKQTN